MVSNEFKNRISNTYDVDKLKIEMSSILSALNSFQKSELIKVELRQKYNIVFYRIIEIRTNEN